jgi:hypothetical protein
MSMHQLILPRRARDLSQQRFTHARGQGAVRSDDLWLAGSGDGGGSDALVDIRHGATDEGQQ